MIRKHNYSWRHVLKPLAASLTVCALMAPTTAAAEKRPLPILNNGQGIAPKVNTAAPKHGNTNPVGESVRMEGKLTLSGKRGLTLDGTPIRISANTSIFPQRDSDRMVDPTSFRGKQVTVFGTKRGGAIEAVLLVVDSGAFNLDQMDSLKEWMIPSDSNPKVGHFRKNAPE